MQDLHAGGGNKCVVASKRSDDVLHYVLSPALHRSFLDDQQQGGTDARAALRDKISTRSILPKGYVDSTSITTTSGRSSTSTAARWQGSANSAQASSLSSSTLVTSRHSSSASTASTSQTGANSAAAKVSLVFASSGANVTSSIGSFQPSASSAKTTWTATTPLVIIPTPTYQVLPARGDNPRTTMPTTVIQFGSKPATKRVVTVKPKTMHFAGPVVLLYKSPALPQLADNARMCRMKSMLEASLMRALLPFAMFRVPPAFRQIAYTTTAGDDDVTASASDLQPLLRRTLSDDSDSASLFFCPFNCATLKGYHTYVAVIRHVALHHTARFARALSQAAKYCSKCTPHVRTSLSFLLATDDSRGTDNCQGVIMFEHFRQHANVDCHTETTTGRGQQQVSIRDRSFKCHDCSTVMGMQDLARHVKVSHQLFHDGIFS